MTTDQIVYSVFGVVILTALVLDLGFLSKKNATISIKQALRQTFLWVLLALGFFIFMWIEEGQKLGLEFLSGYLMEWSLSIDNIFVFILIFDAFNVKEQHTSRVLLIGIIIAILLSSDTNSRIISTPALVSLRSSSDGDGKFVIRQNGKPVYTSLFVVVVLLAAIDLVFALDSIPAVMGISNSSLVIYTSNIFAILGLRSLFFLLRGAVNEFEHLQQGIAIVLVFIGIKMLGEHYISMIMDKNTQVILSLLVIVFCITGSILYSIFTNKQKQEAAKKSS